MYSAVMNTLIKASMYSTTLRCWSNACNTSSFAQKPESGMTPIIASVPIPNTAAVTGIFAARPPSSLMSCFSVAWITDPDARKSSALKNPCTNRYSIAAVTEPEPSATNIKPRLFSVE